MSFLKNIGKSLSDFGQDVANQSKNISDNAKLKAAISQEEKKLDDLYRVLGKTYVDRAINASMHPEHPLASKSVKDLFAMDQGAFTQIQEIREKIQTLQKALEADGTN